MEPSFLLSDTPEGLGQQLIRSVSSNKCPVIVFIKDFDKIANLQQEFPGVTWIAVDVNKNVDSLAKILKLIPTPNYIVNFTGPDFLLATINAYRSCGVTYKERERGQSELTFEGIVDDDDGYECKIIVNVVERRSEPKRKTKTITKKAGKFFRGAKTKLSNLAQEDDDASGEENAPLLTRNDSEEESISPSFMTSVLSFCCPCIFKTPEPEYCFRTPEELQLQMEFEQLVEIKKEFKKLHANSASSWDVAFMALQRKESQKMEGLVARVNDMREQEEQKLSSVKDKQNANTKDRLSGVLSPDAIRKIEESRARQTKGTVKYEADRVYRDQESLILKQVAIDKAQLYERHYLKLIEDQIQKLSEIQTNFQKKTRSLNEKHFNNRA